MHRVRGFRARLHYWIVLHCLGCSFLGPRTIVSLYPRYINPQFLAVFPVSFTCSAFFSPAFVGRFLLGRSVARPTVQTWWPMEITADGAIRSHHHSNEFISLEPRLEEGIETSENRGDQGTDRYRRIAEHIGTEFIFYNGHHIALFSLYEVFWPPAWRIRYFQGLAGWYMRALNSVCYCGNNNSRANATSTGNSVVMHNFLGDGKYSASQ